MSEADDVRDLINDCAIALDIFMLKHAVAFRGTIVVPHDTWGSILRCYAVSYTDAFAHRPKVKGIDIEPGNVRTPMLRAELVKKVVAIEGQNGTGPYEVIMELRADTSEPVWIDGRYMGRDETPIASTAGVRKRHRQRGNLRTSA